MTAMPPQIWCFLLHSVAETTTGVSTSAAGGDRGEYTGGQKRKDQPTLGPSKTPKSFVTDVVRTKDLTSENTKKNKTLTCMKTFHGLKRAHAYFYSQLSRSTYPARDALALRCFPLHCIFVD